MIPYIDPCVVAADEVAALTQWSQAKDKLQRWMWNQGCPQVEPPDISRNWGEEWRQPPASYTTPGNPNDRRPPEN